MLGTCVQCTLCTRNYVPDFFTNIKNRQTCGFDLLHNQGVYKFKRMKKKMEPKIFVYCIVEVGVLLDIFYKTFKKLKKCFYTFYFI